MNWIYIVRCINIMWQKIIWQQTASYRSTYLLHKMKHCPQWDCLPGQWNFCKAFDVKTQLVLDRSVVVSMQLDAVSPLSKYLVQLCNLLFVKWKSIVNVLVQVSEEKSLQYLLEESYYSLPAAFSVLSWCWSGFGPAQCSINSHSAAQFCKVINSMNILYLWDFSDLFLFVCFFNSPDPRNFVGFFSFQ